MRQSIAYRGSKITSLLQVPPPRRNIHGAPRVHARMLMCVLLNAMHAPTHARPPSGAQMCARVRMLHTARAHVFARVHRSFFHRRLGSNNGHEHTHTHMRHACTQHTCMQRDMHTTDMRRDAMSRSHAHNARSCTLSCALSCACSHAQSVRMLPALSPRHACVHARAHTCTHTSTHARMRTHAHTHTRTRTCTHAHTHTITHRSQCRRNSVARSCCSRTHRLRSHRLAHTCIHSMQPRTYVRSYCVCIYTCACGGCGPAITQGDLPLNSRQKHKRCVLNLTIAHTCICMYMSVRTHA